MRRVNVRVTGIVQGVGYRYSLQGAAREAGVAGWVRNRVDDSVEAELRGDPDAVGRVLAWMQRGPRGARVDGVDVRDSDSEGDDRSDSSGDVLDESEGVDFEIRRDA